MAFSARVAWRTCYGRLSKHFLSADAGFLVGRRLSGYLIALGGAVLVLGSVHVWGPPMVFVMLYIGAGVWLHNGVETSRRGPRALRSRDRAAAGQRQCGGAAPGPARGTTASASGLAVRDGPSGFSGESHDLPRRRPTAAPERSARSDISLR